MERRNFLKTAGIVSFLSAIGSGCASVFKSAPGPVNYRGVASLSDGTKAPVEDWAREYAQLWFRSSQEATYQVPLYDRPTRLKNSKMVTGLSQRLNKEFSNLSSSKDTQKRWIRANEVEIRRILQTVFGLNESEVRFLEEKNFVSAVAEYLGAVKTIDSEISAEEIFQAGRNVVMANAIQLLGGMQAQSHSAILAYSLLYPYTDNVIDGDFSRLQKSAISDRFARRLAGEIVRGEFPIEAKMFKMVEMIERQYPRGQNEQIYASLLAIHNAQVASLKEQRWSLYNVKVDEAMVMRSVSKGGASVMADAFLAAGRPTPELAKFSFGLGVLLQLVDDLQDVYQDVNSRHATIFSVSATKNENIDAQANQLLHFSNAVLSQMTTLSNLSSNEIQLFTKLFRTGMLSLVAEAAGSFPQFYSDGYRYNIPSVSPINFEGATRADTLEMTFIRKFNSEGQRITELLNTYVEMNK